MTDVKQGLFGVVATFFPADDLADHIERIAAQVDGLVLVDNSAAPAVHERLRALAQRFGAKLVLHPKNLGIAVSLNAGVELARAVGAARVAFFDQDSEIFPDYRQEIDAVWFGYAEKPPLGILGCNSIAAASGAVQYRKPSALGYVHVLDVMTSASVYDMAMLAALGPFADDYFIDSVDIEYGWRAKTRGYAVCRTVKPLLSHSIGRQTVHTLLGRGVTTTNHPAWRRYYMTRNTLFLVRRYGLVLPGPCWKRFVRQLRQMLYIALFEQDRGAKIRCCLLGFWHGAIGCRKGLPPRG